MRILLITAVYPPEPVVSARLSQDLREYLVERGHTVHVLCPVPSRGGHDTAGAAPGAVTKLNSYRCPVSRLIGRARESWDFGRRAADWIAAQPQGSFDVIYANVWPLLAPYHIVCAARACAIPVVMHVQDVYPESLATKLPTILYRLASLPLKAWDRAVVRRCAAIVLPSVRIGRAYSLSRKLDGRVHVVRNWVDPTPFDVLHDRSAVCREYDVPTDRFTFMYLGNLSALSALDTAICAFASAADDTQQFVIVGEGSLKKHCQEIVRSQALKNIWFRSEPDAAKVARVQSMADAFVLPTRRGGSISSTPSKCISYMLSAKPIIGAVDAQSDTADDLRSAECAWLCAPGDSSDLAGCMRAAREASLCTVREMGRSGRGYAMRCFAKDVCLPLMADIIESNASGKHR